MKRIFVFWFSILLPLLALGAASDVQISQKNASDTAWKMVTLSPVANSLLGFDASKGLVNVTIGTGVSLSSNVLTGTAGGGNVSTSGTPSSGQAAEFTSSTAITGIAVTGTVAYVKSTSPTLVTPTLGVASATSINKVAITAPATSATLTIANGKTLTANNTLTFAGTDGTTMTFPSTTATIARTDAANTFTGIQSMTSPAITTSITTPSTAFAAFNTTATTVNAFGAATTLNIGASAATVLNFGGATSSAEFRFLEPSGSGTNYTGFKAQAQGANITYTLPSTVGGAGTVLTDAAGNGTLSWGSAGAGTVSVVGAGSLTSTALVTGGGTTTLQTPSSTATMDSSGNISTPGTVTVGSGASTAGAISLKQGTTQSTGTTNITIQAPTAVTSHIYTLPGTVGTNGAFWTQTTSGTTATLLNTKVVPTGTVVGDTDTQTLTNKNVTPRVLSLVADAAPSPAWNSYDVIQDTAMTATCVVGAETTTPSAYQQIEFCFTSSTTAARTITWNALFVDGPVARPTTTLASTKALRVWFEYDPIQSKFVCMSTGSDL